MLQIDVPAAATPALSLSNFTPTSSTFTSVPVSTLTNTLTNTNRILSVDYRFVAIITPSSINFPFKLVQVVNYIIFNYRQAVYGYLSEDSTSHQSYTDPRDANDVDFEPASSASKVGQVVPVQSMSPFT